MDTTPRKRYTRAERDDYLERFDQSGMSAKRFASEVGLKYPTFAYWLKARREAAKPQSFVELEIDKPRPGDASSIEIFLPSGASLRAFDAASAASLLRELGLAC